MSISLDEIVDINVSLSSGFAANTDFRLGLIISQNTIIQAEDRVKIYANLKEVLEDGFETTSLEYKAAQGYFSQQPKPPSLAIGCKGAEETFEAAFNACREVNNDWYACALVGTDLEVTDQIIETVAAAVAAQKLPTKLVFQTKDSKCLTTGEATNIFSKLKAANNGAAIGIYSKNAMAAPSLLGLITGLNSLNPNSAFTLAYKKIIGITAENIGSGQLKALKGYNGNAVVNFGGKFNVFVQGTMTDGQHYDDIYCVDALKTLIQQNVINLLITTKKVAQTDDGMVQIASRIASGCEKLKLAGYIAPGIWNGETILDELFPGDALPSGYMILFQSVTEQDQSEREQRVTPLIYVPVKLAGAIEHVTIAVNVNK